MGLVKLMESEPSYRWDMLNEKRYGGISCLATSDVTRDGLPEILVGRDDGVVEVYGMDEANEPRLRFTHVSHTLSALYRGTIALWMQVALCTCFSIAVSNHCTTSLYLQCVYVCVCVALTVMLPGVMVTRDCDEISSSVLLHCPNLATFHSLCICCALRNHLELTAIFTACYRPLQYRTVQPICTQTISVQALSAA